MISHAGATSSDLLTPVLFRFVMVANSCGFSVKVIQRSWGLFAWEHPLQEIRLLAVGLGRTQWNRPANACGQRILGGRKNQPESAALTTPIGITDHTSMQSIQLTLQCRDGLAIALFVPPLSAEQYSEVLAISELHTSCHELSSYLAKAVERWGVQLTLELR